MYYLAIAPLQQEGIYTITGGHPPAAAIALIRRRKQHQHWTEEDEHDQDQLSLSDTVAMFILYKAGAGNNKDIKIEDFDVVGNPSGQTGRGSRKASSHGDPSGSYSLAMASGSGDTNVNWFLNSSRMMSNHWVHKM